MTLGNKCLQISAEILVGPVSDWPLYERIVYISSDWLAGISHGLEPEASPAREKD